MKYLVMLLTLTLGLANAHERQKSIKMTFSGTGGASGINLQIPNTHTGEDNFAGDGTLGSFTVRIVEADPTSPQFSSTCSGSTILYFQTVAASAVFRFEDGSLLKVSLVEGNDCIDLQAREAHCTRTFKIIGGTGRFTDASGTLTLTYAAVPVLADAFNNPVFFAATGELTGTVSGIARNDDDDRDGRH